MHLRRVGHVVRVTAFPELKGSANPTWGGGNWNQALYRHNEGGNLLMFDGHVEIKPKTEVFVVNPDNSVNRAKIDDLWFSYR